MTDHNNGPGKVKNDGTAYFIDPLGATPAGAIFRDGKAFKATGEQYVKVIAGAVPAGAVYLGGEAYTQDGQMYVRKSATGAGAVNRGGFAYTQDGAGYAQTVGSAVAYQGILGILSDGSQLCTGI